MTTEGKAYDFSVRVAECVRYLREENKGFPLCDRLLACGVSAGIAVRGGNKELAVEYITQADYILEMAARSGYMTATQTERIRDDAKKLLEELN